MLCNECPRGISWVLEMFRARRSLRKIAGPKVYFSRPSWNRKFDEPLLVSPFSKPKSNLQDRVKPSLSPYYKPCGLVRGPNSRPIIFGVGFFELWLSAISKQAAVSWMMERNTMAEKPEPGEAGIASPSAPWTSQRRHRYSFRVHHLNYLQLMKKCSMLQDYTAISYASDLVCESTHGQDKIR